MFDSVLGRGVVPRSRFGTGAVTSLLLHASFGAGALFLSSRAPDVAGPEKDLPHLVVFHDSKPAGGGRPAAAPRAAQPRTPRPKPRAPLLIPSTIPPPPPRAPPAQTPPETPTPSSDAVGNPGDGPISSGPADSTGVGPGDGSGPGGPSGGGEGVEIFTDGMTRPVQLEGRDPQYTREALEAHVEGNIIARCVITTQGRIENCRIIKGLPHMNQAVLEALATKRYTPVMYQGRPVAVQYVFEFRLMLPR